MDKQTQIRTLHFEKTSMCSPHAVCKANLLCGHNLHVSLRRTLSSQSVVKETKESSSRHVVWRLVAPDACEDGRKSEKRISLFQRWLNVIKNTALPKFLLSV
jgi:hypothetical protein